VKSTTQLVVSLTWDFSIKPNIHIKANGIYRPPYQKHHKTAATAVLFIIHTGRKVKALNEK
jgi:hypothetical protein